MRLPIKRAWIETTGRDVTEDIKRLDGPTWLVGSTWTPLWPSIRAVCGLRSGGIYFELKIFKKFFLKEEGPVSIHFWGQVKPDLT